MKQIKTLQQAIVHFADREHCREFMVFLRWPDGGEVPVLWGEQGDLAGEGERLPLLWRSSEGEVLVEGGDCV